MPRPSGARPGRPAPWAHFPPEHLKGLTLEVVAGRIKRARPHGGDAGPRRVTAAELPSTGDKRPAAVLCLLFEHGGQASVVLTRRAAHLRDHAGEVSFPGGRLGPGELPLTAALREAEEEVGVDSRAVTILGELTPLTAGRSPALVRCFVGSYSPSDQGPGLVPNEEVARAFWAPLAGLASPGSYHEELWPPRAGTTPSGYEPVPFFEHDGEVIWGATGRLLVELLNIVLELPGHPPLQEGSLEGS